MRAFTKPSSRENSTEQNLIETTIVNFDVVKKKKNNNPQTLEGFKVSRQLIIQILIV